MDLQTGVTILTIVAGSLSLGLAFLLWQFRAVNGSLPLMGTALWVTLWALLYTLELQSGLDADRLLLWNRAKRIGMVYVELGLFLFALQYHGYLVSRLWWVLLGIVPTTAWLINLFNPSALFWQAITPGVSNGITFLYTEPALWQIIQWAYSLIMLVLVMGVFLRHERDFWQKALGLGAVIVPFVLYVSLINAQFVVDYMPLVYSLSLVILVFGVMQLGVFDVLPDAYDTVIKNNPDGVLVIDTRNRILMMNPIFMETTETSKSDIGKLAHSIFGRYAESLFRLKDVVEGQAEIEENDRHIEVRVIPLRHGAQLRGRAFLFRDITDSKRAEVALRESEMRYRTLFDEAQDAIIVEDNRMRIVDANRAATRLMGYSYAELLSMTIDQVQKHDNFRTETPQSGRFEVKATRKDGTMLDIELTLAPIPMGERMLYMSIIRDVTERNRTQAELKQRADELARLYEQLRHLEQYKTDMIRMAAHDLRHPISVTQGYLELLQEPNSTLTPNQQLYLDAIRSATARANQMLSDILSLERIEHLATMSVYSPFNLHELLGEIIAQYRDQASAKGLQMIIDVDGDESPYVVLGDTTQITEAISNLLNNAVKYTPEMGKLFIRLRHDEAYAHFEVQDTGYGIMKEQQEKLFRPFYRAKSSANQHIDGTGLGLHLVKSIIERHNGNIFFSSEYGKGSLFGFRLPLANLTEQAKTND